MKKINLSIRIIVGILFVFSGLIKVNDPIGTAIKLEEYFEVFTTDFSEIFHYFIPFSLAFSLFLCILEVLLGVALLVKFKERNTITILLWMIIFFSFLTFYSAYFNKVTDCGCFGDAIPLTPWQSFSKDIFLFLCISLLFFRRKNLSNNISKISIYFIVGNMFLSMTISYIGINHLPIIDFRNYKKGNNIAKLMNPSIPCKRIYIMEKGGKEFEFKKYPRNKSYKYKAQKILNPKECFPKITDYHIWDTLGNNMTEESLNGKKLFIIIQKQKNISLSDIEKIIKLIKTLPEEITPMIISSDGYHSPSLREEKKLNLPYYLADVNVLKAMIRSNPGIIYLENGTVINKWHINDIENFRVKKY